MILRKQEHYLIIFGGLSSINKYIVSDFVRQVQRTYSQERVIHSFYYERQELIQAYCTALDLFDALLWNLTYK